MENLATSCVDCNLGKGALSCGYLEAEPEPKPTWEDLFWDQVEARGLLSRRAPKEPRGAFSPRQLDVIRAVALGLGQSGIAEHLKIARATVAVHLQTVYRKVGIKAPSAASKLVVWAIDNGYGPDVPGCDDLADPESGECRTNSKLTMDAMMENRASGRTL